jgi:hypothetical protein
MEKSPFSGKPSLVYVGNSLSRLVDKFSYYPPEKYGYKPVHIPANFKTDLVSVPPFARWLIHKYDDTIMGALPHDYLYHTQIRSRKESDHIFLLAMIDADKMEDYKIPSWKRQIIYRAVRFGGWLPWMKRAKEIQAIRKQLENDGVERMEKSSHQDKKGVKYE